MTNNKSVIHNNRILLAIDMHTMSLNTLEIAFYIAAVFKAGIKGLFVEDMDLIRLAQLPFSHEISSGYAKRHLTNYRMERDLQDFAKKMQQRIAEAAEKMDVPWSFEVIRGNFLSEYDTLSNDVNLVLYGSIDERTNLNPLTEIIQHLNLTSNLNYFKGPVVTFCDNLKSSHCVFTKAAHLASIGDSDLVVIIPPTEYSEFENLAKEVVKNIHHRVFFVKTTELNLDLVYSIAKQVHAGIIVMDKYSSIIKTGDLQRVLKLQGCLFLLVSNSVKPNQ